MGGKGKEQKMGRGRRGTLEEAVTLLRYFNTRSPRRFITNHELKEEQALEPIHMGSQVPLLLASPNMEAKSQVLRLAKLFKYGLIIIKSWTLIILCKYIYGTCVHSGVYFFVRPNSQHKSQALPPKSVAIQVSMSCVRLGT